MAASRFFRGPVANPYETLDTLKRPKEPTLSDDVPSPPDASVAWRGVPVAPRLTVHKIHLLTLIDDAMHGNGAEATATQCDVAVCEAAPMLVATTTYTHDARSFVVPYPIMAILYMLKVRLLDGHYLRLARHVGTWVTSARMQLVDAIVDRASALLDRLGDTRLGRQYYTHQMPRMVMCLTANSTTRAELDPCAAYALTSVLLACTPLHSWTTMAVIPPALLSAYSRLPRTVANAVLPAETRALALDETITDASVTINPVGRGVRVSGATVAAMYLYMCVLQSRRLDGNDRMLPLFARWMMWQPNAAMEPMLRWYLNIAGMRSDEKSGMPAVTRLAVHADCARAYATSHVTEVAMDPTLRESIGRQLDLLHRHVAPRFPLSAAMLMTCAPVPVVTTEAVEAVALPDVSLIGVQNRSVRISGGPESPHGVTPRVLYHRPRDPSDTAYDASIQRLWTALLRRPGGSVTALVYTFETPDVADSVLNLIHCMRMHGAAYGAHTTWCDPRALVASPRCVMIDAPAARVMTLMNIRAQMLIAPTVGYSRRFACLAPLLYRELRALPNIWPIGIRRETAAVLCDIMGSIMFRRAPLEMTAVEQSLDALKYRFPTQPHTCTVAESMMSDVMMPFLGIVVPHTLSACPEGAEMDYVQAIASTAMCISAPIHNAVHMRATPGAWLQILRVFFVADRMIADGEDASLPSIMTDNPGAVNALALLYASSQLDTVTATKVTDAALSVASSEPDIMGMYTESTMPTGDSDDESATALPGCRRSRNRTRYADRVPMLFEDYLTRSRDIRSLQHELDALANRPYGGDERVRLYDVCFNKRTAFRTLRAAVLRAHDTNIRCVTIGSAIGRSKYQRRKRDASSRGPRRKKSAHAEDVHDDDDDDDDDDQDDNTNGDHAHVPDPREKYKNLCVLRDRVDAIGRFAIMALICATHQDPAMYGAATSRVVLCTRSSSHNPRRIERLGLGTLSPFNTPESIRTSIEAVRAQITTTELPGQYEATWYPCTHSDRASFDDAVIRSLFFLELIPCVTASVAINVYRTVGNSLLASHRFRDLASYDIPYIDAISLASDKSPIVHRAYSMTHGVCDGYVRDVSTPLTGPRGVASAAVVPYRMSATRWAAQMQLEGPVSRERVDNDDDDDDNNNSNAPPLGCINASIADMFL